MTTTSQTIIRLYIKEIDSFGYDRPASDEEVMQTTMDLASQTKVDIDEAAWSLQQASDNFDITINELVAAITELSVYTQCTLRESIWQLHRVVTLVQKIEPGTA